MGIPELQHHQHLVSKCAASPGTGLFKGFGTLSQQAKTDPRRQCWESVLSVCIYKRPACPVVRLWIMKHLKSTVQNEPLTVVRYFASSVFVPTKTRNNGSRRCRKSLFLLVGRYPKPSEQTAPLVWLRGNSAASGYRPLLIFRSRPRSGDCGFSEGTGAAPAKFSSSALPACFRNS